MDFCELHSGQQNSTETSKIELFVGSETNEKPSVQTTTTGEKSPRGLPIPRVYRHVEQSALDRLG